MNDPTCKESLTPPEQMSVPWSLLTQPLKWIAEAVKARQPFHVSASIGNQPATIIVTVINRTKDFPLHIHEIRIHVGIEHYTYFFRLKPHDSMQIAPRARQEYHLPFTHSIVGHRYISKSAPNLNARNSGPSFDGPADLFKAMARAARRDVWLEIDFNEFNQKEFLRGELQSLFYDITQMRPPKATQQ